MVEIVSNSERQIDKYEEFSYVYIPLSEKEKEVFAPNTLNACWRIKV